MELDMPVIAEPPERESEPVKKTRKPKVVVFETFRKGTRVGGRTIQLGSAGVDVARLQHILNRRHQQRAALIEDGLFGPLTEAEVKKTQKFFKIKTDGVVGRATWAALGW